MKRIQSFPPPLPDEDYRNLVFRHQLQTPYEFYGHARTELLGRLMLSKIIYPENLSRLEQHLGVGDDFINEIVMEHTFFPFLRPFMTPEQLQESKRSMFQPGYIRNPLIRTGLRSYISSTERYCPTCLHEDAQQYGVSYLHRIHQFNFLSSCHMHGDALIHECPMCNVPLTNQSGSQMLTEPRCQNGHEIYELLRDQKSDTSFPNMIINEFKELMNFETSVDVLVQRLLASLGNRGYIHFKGDFIYKNELINDVIEHYGKEDVESLGIRIENLRSVGFLAAMFKTGSIQGNILFYILIMRFLGGSVRAFFNLNERYSIDLPFGTGPWRCMNYICPDYYKKVIRSCKRKAHEWVTGTFTCPTCGMKYTRCGLPKEEDESQYSIDTMGALFIDKALKYYREGYQINEIAGFMNSNKKTIGKYLRPFREKVRTGSKRVNIQEARKVIELGYREAAAASVSKIDICKETMLEAISVLGIDASRPSIRKYNIHRYDWLMKNEREWMEGILPAKKVMDKVLDRETMDDEMSRVVADAVRECRNNPPKHIISASAIFRLLPTNIYTRYLNHKAILPKTVQIVQEGVETRDQYAIRIFPKVVEWFRDSRYKTISLRLVQTKFAVYKKLKPETLSQIQDLITKL